MNEITKHKKTPKELLGILKAVLIKYKVRDLLNINAWGYSDIERDIVNNFLKNIEFNNCNIEFSNIQYEKSNKNLRVGDIIRITDVNINEYDYEESVEYAIYTWIPDYHGYIWATESELYDYITCTWDNWCILHKSWEHYIHTIKENMENVKYLGNISDEKIRNKLDDRFQVYSKLYKY